MEDLQKNWRDLEAAKTAKESEMEHRSGMEAFDDAVKNASDYISEKAVVLRIEVPAKPDVAVMRNLHKKIANFERELIPIQQMIDSVKQRGIPLRKQYPNEGKHISTKEKELESQAKELQDYLKNKRNELECDVSLTVFQSALGELNEWNDRVGAALRENPDVDDHKMASELCQQHSNLADEIKSHDPEFEYVAELARKTLTANPVLEQEVKKVLAEVQSAQNNLKQDGADKSKALKYVEDLLDLNRRVNRALDDMTRLEGILSESPDLGTNHAEVETLLRRHEDLDRDLDATEQRSESVLMQGGKLINNPPSNRLLIRRPHEKVSTALLKLQDWLNRFPNLRDSSKQRKLLLLDSLAYQTWKGDVEDLNQWMDNLLPIMESDPSEEDISSEKAYRRHAKQVFKLLRWNNRETRIEN